MEFVVVLNPLIKIFEIKVVVKLVESVVMVERVNEKYNEYVEY